MAGVSQAIPPAGPQQAKQDGAPLRAPFLVSAGPYAGLMDDITWANTWHQHLTQKAAGNDLALAVLELHKPNDRGECGGCDAEGYEAENPDYPCQTTVLVAESFGSVLERRCEVCRHERRVQVDGNFVGHHRRVGDMYESCSGTPEQVKPFPARSHAEVMAEFTEKLTTGLAAAVGRMAQAESAFGIPASPVPAVYQLAQVKKWEYQMPPEWLARYGVQLSTDETGSVRIVPDTAGGYRLPAGVAVTFDVPDTSELSVGRPVADK